MIAEMTGTATFDASGLYRYTLTRIWDPDLPVCVWVMLNPSTADANRLDPTVTRCVAFARLWGYGGIIVVNLFALRSTDPRGLLTGVDPIGPANDYHIAMATKDRAPASIIAAWGSHGGLHGRDTVVRQLLRRVGRVRCLGHTQGGQPLHPLYLRADTAPIPL